MTTTILDILRTVATAGTPPSEGCARIDFGSNQPVVTRLVDLHVRQDMSAGRAAQKLIVGSYGSGKTHLLRQTLEEARDAGCATAEAAVTPATDLANPLFLYRDVTRNIRPPGEAGVGMESLLGAALRSVRSRFGDNFDARAPTEAWIADVENVVRTERSIGRQLRVALRALHDGDRDEARMALRWLEGEVDGPAVAKATRETKLDKVGQKLFGGNGLISLAEFVRHAGWTGLVVGFDEADQGFSVPPKRRDAILSVLRSDFDAVLRSRGAPLLSLIAITPDMRNAMSAYPALQQRLRPPDGIDFFDGESEAHTRAPIIDLDRRYDPGRDLPALAARLVEAFYIENAVQASLPKSQALSEVALIVREIQNREAAADAQRQVAKAVAVHLIRAIEPAFTPPPPAPEQEA